MVKAAALLRDARKVISCCITPGLVQYIFVEPTELTDSNVPVILYDAK
jgi:hypothetical protein